MRAANFIPEANNKYDIKYDQPQRCLEKKLNQKQHIVITLGQTINDHNNRCF